MTVKPIILDTDIGDDIDDAFALLFALKCSELELEAVTVVWGDVETRARLASKLISTLGLKTPVAQGSPQSLLGFKPGWKPCQAEVLKEGEAFSNILETPAWNIISEKACEVDGLDLVSIGPMTNIALTLLFNHGFEKRVGLTSMAGVFKGSGAEYNVKCDPEALSLVLKSGLNPLLVGLDVTMKCVMPMSMVEKLKSSGKPEHRLVSTMLDAWTGSTGFRQPVLHDPLALATLVDYRIVNAEKTRVEVELKGEYTRGFTVITNGAPNASVCLNVDVDRFLRLFEEVVF
ncbi:MAG: nucleoside hydrolase [Candidatus Brockarchaeota archaeon]|nr:nucleoside hydrolase [Candidatus Brockarchaeota archaeon]